jgi:excisionase family DNA binding protein
MAAVTESDDTLLLRPTDGARELRVSLATFYNLLRDGTIPSVKIRGARRIRRQDLTDYVASRLQEGWETGDDVATSRR